MKLETAADYIAFFEKIPDSEWTIGVLENVKGQRCALGHCFYSTPRGAYDATVNNLPELFRKKLRHRIDRVNDEFTDDFPQSTPKARILAALAEIERRGG